MADSSRLCAYSVIYKDIRTQNQRRHTKDYAEKSSSPAFGGFFTNFDA